METNRRRQAIDKPLAQRLARHVAYLQKELDAIDQDIGDAIKHSPAWREAEALLKSVPCIGDVTSSNFSPNRPNSGLSAAIRLLPWLASPRSIATLV